MQHRVQGDRAVENTQRLRGVLEALGPAFVKLGQAASCREDILSEAVAAELRKLCDQAGPPHTLEICRGGGFYIGLFI